MGYLKRYFWVLIIKRWVYKYNRVIKYTFIIKLVLNRLTPLYSKIYYKKEKLFNNKDCVFKYITPFYSKGLVY
jgi:hypothetical protein